MSVEIDALTGRVAVPRSNGELVFAAPWQGRIFGLAVALCEHGHFTWDEFRDRLVSEVADGDGEDYYASWMSALNAVLVHQSIVEPGQVDQRMTEYLNGDRDEVL